MSSSEIINGNENGSKKEDEREIIDLDEKLRDAIKNHNTKNEIKDTSNTNSDMSGTTNKTNIVQNTERDTTNSTDLKIPKGDITDELKNSFKKILSKSKQKQNSKAEVCTVRSIIEDLNQKNAEIYNKMNENIQYNDENQSEVCDERLSEVCDEKLSEVCDEKLSEIGDEKQSELCDEKLSEIYNKANKIYNKANKNVQYSETKSSDEKLSELCDEKQSEIGDEKLSENCNSSYDTSENSLKNEINIINKKLDRLCMKLNEDRIKSDLENKNKFKKLLDTVSSHLNVQLVNAVENTIKREVKSGILQIKKIVGESVLSLENKSVSLISEMSQTKIELPESKYVLETIKQTMIDVFLPVIESCIEEMRSQIIVELKNSVGESESRIKTVSMKDEIVDLLHNENINDACVLALDCGDELVHTFVESCSVNLLEKLDPSLQGLLLKKTISMFGEFESERIINFISNILIIFEIQDLSLEDLIEVQNILEFLSTIDTNDNMRLIIKMQGNQIKKMIMKQRR